MQKINEIGVSLTVGQPRKLPAVVEMWQDKDGSRHIVIETGFQEKPMREALKAEMRNMLGYKYLFFNEQIGCGKRHAWYFPSNEHNDFALSYLMCKNPYARWRTNYEKVVPTRSGLRAHQIENLTHIVRKRHVHLTGDMGIGKSLISIEATEIFKKEVGHVPNNLIWYVGPKSAKKSYELELRKWNANFRPEMMTYEALTSKMKKWSSGDPAPRVIIFDECSKLKNMKSQRTQAAAHIARSIRQEYGFESIIVLMSGTPAPRSPVDWWAQAEITRPGFLVEPTLQAFDKTLCIKEMRPSLTGGSYPHILGFRDDERKCKWCSKTEEEHSPSAPFYQEPQEYQKEMLAIPPNHRFEKSVNEVSRLHKRLDGLTLITLKEDCLDLPPKEYVLKKVKPAPESLRAMRLIKETARTAAVALARMRQLADGFNYTTMQDGFETCELCSGSGLYKQPTDEVETTCPNCDGDKEVPKYVRGVVEVDCPKDAVLLEELEAHEEYGRFVVFGSLTATLDRIEEVVKTQDWSTLRISGQGWVASDFEGEPLDADELLMAMDYSHPRRQEFAYKYPKICVVGNPKSCSMGLTLTNSPSILYYSNDYDGEARIQSEARIHRLGGRDMPARIVDVVHLPVDRLVQENLKKKENLQALTLGKLWDEIEECSR